MKRGAKARSARALAASLLLALLFTCGCFAHEYRSNPRVAVVEGDPIVQMKAPGKFPIVTKPSLVAPVLHSDPPDEDSRVLGLTVGAVPRAYPIGLLDRFEVVNDSVPGLSRTEFERLIRETGRVPFERDASYRRVLREAPVGAV